MDNNFNEPEEALEGLFHTLIDEAPERLQSMMLGRDKDNIHISAPLFLVRRFMEALMRRTGLRSDFIFMGIKIIPSSDYALTLFHVDYPIFKDDWMIHKISLDPLFVSKPQSNVTKYFGQIKEFIPGGIDEGNRMN